MDIIKEVEAALEKATPGPYYADTEEWPGNSQLKYWVQTHIDGIGAFVRHEDAIIAANAPEWLRHLLSIISKQNEEIERNKATVREALEALERAADLGSTGEDARWMHVDVDYAISELKKLEENPHVKP